MNGSVPGRGWLAPDRLAGAAIGLALLATLGLFLITALGHIRYPFELEWMEGGMLDHVQRLLDGKPLYAPPSLDFTAFSYTPLWFCLSAGLAGLFGLSLGLLRTLSVIATLATLLIIGRWVQRETGSRRAGGAAAALYLATWPVSGRWFDLARVDALFLLLLLAGLALLRRREGPAAAVAAALLLALAFFCKQTALVIILPVLLWTLIFRPAPQRWLLPACFLLLAGAGIWILEHMSGGWFSYYAFYLPRQHPPVFWRIHHFWIDYFFRPLPLALLLGALWPLASWWQKRARWQGAARGPRVAGWWRPGRRGRRDWWRMSAWRRNLGWRLNQLRQQDLFWPFALAGLFAGPWLAVIPSGAYHNVAMPAHAGLALLVGLGLGRWQRQSRARSAALQLMPWLLLLLQLLFLGYAPGAQQPDPASRRAGEALVARLAAAPGPVWAPSHGYLAHMAGKNGSAHRCALDDVLRGPLERGKRGLLEEIGEALASERYQVVIASDGWLEAELRRLYGAGEQIFNDPRLFFPLTGWQTRPERWYERRAPDENGPQPD